MPKESACAQKKPPHFWKSLDLRLFYWIFARHRPLPQQKTTDVHNKNKFYNRNTNENTDAASIEERVSGGDDDQDGGERGQRKKKEHPQQKTRKILGFRV